MQEIPLQPIPAQTFKVVLAGQNCTLNIYQKSQGLFLDLNVDGVDIVQGVIARNAVKLNCREYEPFVGNLIFIDTQGSSDPEYTGLDSRFGLVYITTDEENAIVQ